MMLFTIIEWVLYVLIILFIYYIYKIIAPGSTLLPNTIKHIGNLTAETVRETKRAKRKIKKTLRREYEYAKNMIKLFEELVAEAEEERPNKIKMAQMFDKVVNKFKKEIKWNALARELEGDINLKIRDAKVKSGLKGELTAISDKILLELDDIKKNIKDERFAKSIENVNKDVIAEFCNDCIKKLENIDNELAAMQELEDEIVKEAGNK